MRKAGEWANRTILPHLFTTLFDPEEVGQPGRIFPGQAFGEALLSLPGGHAHFPADPAHGIQHRRTGTCFLLGMELSAIEKLKLTPQLERVFAAARPGELVRRIGNEYAHF